MIVKQVKRQSTFCLNRASCTHDQSSLDLVATSVTAISIPLDSLPLYNVQSGKEPRILLKSSQALSISSRLSDDTPAYRKNNNNNNNIAMKTLKLNSRIQAIQI